MTADSDCRFCADPGKTLSLASDLNELRLKHGIIWMQAGSSDLEFNKKAELLVTLILVLIPKV